MRQLRITKQITTRDNSMEKYLQEVKPESTISVDEEIELAKRVQKGDMQAREQLIRAHLRFVISVAKQYQNRGLSLADLINEGNIGLIIGAERYDPTRGFKLISYCVWWIRQKIMQAIQEKSKAIRPPLNKIALAQKIFKASQELKKEKERNATYQEIADKIGVTPEEVERTLEHNIKALSIDESFIQGEDNKKQQDVLEDQTSPAADRNLVEESKHDELIEILHKLSPRERNVLMKHYGIGEKSAIRMNYGKTLEEIGLEEGLTRERVRQIKEKALKQARMLVAKKTKSYSERVSPTKGGRYSKV